MTERCPKCGSEMRHTTSLDGDSFWCQDCHIKELEQLLEEVDTAIEDCVDDNPDEGCRCFFCQGRLVQRYQQDDTFDHQKTCIVLKAVERQLARKKAAQQTEKSLKA